MKQALFLIGLLAISIHIPGDYVFLQWAVGFALAAIILATQIKNKLAATTLLYFLGNAIYFFGTRHNVYANNPQFQSLAMAASGYSALAMLCVLLPINPGRYRFELGIFGAFNAALVILGHIFHWDIPGLLDYRGMNAVLIAFSVPFLLELLFKTEDQQDDILISIYLHRAIFLLPCIIAIAMSGASIPYGVLAIELLAFFLIKLKSIKVAIPIAMLPMLIGKFTEREQLFDSSQRFDAYKLFMGQWWEHANHCVGAGAGMFQLIAPGIQIKNGFGSFPDGHWDIFLWLHSDWLQILFEFGFIGLILAIALYAQVLWKLWKANDAGFFALAVGVGGAAIFDYPLRYCATALFAGLALKQSLRVKQCIKS